MEDLGGLNSARQRSQVPKRASLAQHTFALTGHRRQAIAGMACLPLVGCCIGPSIPEQCSLCDNRSLFPEVAALHCWWHYLFFSDKLCDNGSDGLRIDTRQSKTSPKSCCMHAQRRWFPALPQDQLEDSRGKASVAERALADIRQVQEELRLLDNLVLWTIPIFTEGERWHKWLGTASGSDFVLRGVRPQRRFGWKAAWQHSRTPLTGKTERATHENKSWQDLQASGIQVSRQPTRKAIERASHAQT